MKHSLLVFIVIIPIQLCAQLEGRYSLIVDERASRISFEEDHNFRYIPNGKSELLGSGRFRLNADTLTLVFDAYADPEIPDCSGYEVTYDSKLSYPDSINIQLQVFDCQTEEQIPFCSILVQPYERYDSISYNSFNGFIYERTIDTGPYGRANVRLATKMISKEIRISSPEYNEVDFKIPAHASSIRLRINLLADYHRTTIAGGSQQYLIEKKKKRYMQTRRLSSKIYGREKVFFLRERKNRTQLKIPASIKKYYHISPMR